MPGAILSVLASWAILPFHYLSKRGNSGPRSSLQTARHDAVSTLNEQTLRIVTPEGHSVRQTEEARLRRYGHHRRGFSYASVLNTACSHFTRA